MACGCRQAWVQSEIRDHDEASSTQSVRIFRLWNRAVSTVGGLIVALFATSGHAADGPIQLNVVGGLAAVSQYEQFEKPFWTRDVPAVDGGTCPGGHPPIRSERPVRPGDAAIHASGRGSVRHGAARHGVGGRTRTERGRSAAAQPGYAVAAKNGDALPSNICIRSCSRNMASNCSASMPIRLRCCIARSLSPASRILPDARSAPPRSASPR